MPRAVVTHVHTTVPSFVSDLYVLFDVGFVAVERGASPGTVGIDQHTSVREAEYGPI